MKRLLLILLCLPIIGFCQLNLKTYVPDDNFETYLEVNGMGDGIQLNDSINTLSIEMVMYLDVSNQNISDLTGIEDFIVLAELNCQNNQLTSLDVNQNTYLTELNCQNNQLTSLDISQNIALIYFFCGNNYIECLDASSNTALVVLDCSINLLEQLNTKNGNFLNMSVNALSNNLNCIEADNIANANSNWLYDNGVIFNTDCNYTNPCATISAIEEYTANKDLLRITDILGREIKQKKNKLLFYIYDNGTVEKRIVIE